MSLEGGAGIQLVLDVGGKRWISGGAWNVLARMECGGYGGPQLERPENGRIARHLYSELLVWFNFRKEQNKGTEKDIKQRGEDKMSVTSTMHARNGFSTFSRVHPMLVVFKRDK